MFFIDNFRFDELVLKMLAAVVADCTIACQTPLNNSACVAPGIGMVCAVSATIVPMGE
jgi:hypothetical protein